MDECAGKVNGGCYDQCKNTVGSFHCYCKVGFILAEDKYTCISKFMLSKLINCMVVFSVQCIFGNKFKNSCMLKFGISDEIFTVTPYRCLCSEMLAIELCLFS